MYNYYIEEKLKKESEKEEKLKNELLHSQKMRKSKFK